MHLYRIRIRNKLADLFLGRPCPICWQRRCTTRHQTPRPPGWVLPVVEAEAERIAAIIRQQMEAQLAAAFARTTTRPRADQPDLLAPWLPTVEHTVPKDL